MRMAKVLGALALAGTLASPTFAEDQHGWRLGLGIASEKLEGELTDTLFSPDPVDTNVERLGYSAMLGYTFTNWIAVELGFHGGTEFNQDIPEFAAQITSVQPPLTDPVTPDTPPFYINRNDFKSLEGSAVFSWWITDKFSLFGRAGLVSWRDETYVVFGEIDAAAPNKFSASTSDSGVAPLFGLGVQTTLDGALIRLEYKYADVGDLNFGPGSEYSQQENTISSVQFSLVWQLR
jgi:opacity protein-like surface antigen